MKRRLYFMWCISHKIALSNCTCVRKSSWNCSIKSSLNLVSWASKLRAIPPADTTYRPSKRQHWRCETGQRRSPDGGLLFFIATSITLPPSPASDWRRLSWFFPLRVLKIAFRSGFIQVAKKQQKQWDSQWLSSPPSFFSVKLICSG